MARSDFVTRFAPSPTGFLHLGHALSATLVFEAAQRHNGQFLLRMENIDHTRCKPTFEAAIYEDLRWLGLSWELPVRRQSEHGAFYARGLQYLRDLDLLYPSYASRQGLTQVGHSPADPLASPAWRLDLAKAFDYALAIKVGRVPAPERFFTAPFPTVPVSSKLEPSGNLPSDALGFWQKADPMATDRAPDWQSVTADNLGLARGSRPATADVIIGRRDIGFSYHLCAVLDDALQGITHIIRGQDLADVTPLHCVLQTIFGLPTPVYHFHPLLLAADGAKLAKSRGSTALRHLREAGWNVERIRKACGLE